MSQVMTQEQWEAKLAAANRRTPEQITADVQRMTNDVLVILDDAPHPMDAVNSMRWAFVSLCRSMKISEPEAFMLLRMTFETIGADCVRQELKRPA